MTKKTSLCAPRMTMRAAGLLVSASILSAAAQAQTTAGNFYFFGDSATGQGNWSAIAGDRDEDHYPYSSNNGFQRESNGLIWAEMLGRDVDIISDPDRDSKNVNFAISGAHMTEGGDLQEYGIDTGVRVQTEFFENLVQDGDITIRSNDVFFMLAGANDFLDRLEMDDPAEEIQADVVNAAIINIETLVEAGAKTIILSEIQPIQYAPEFSEDAETRSILSALMAETNGQIAARIDALELGDDVNIITQKYTDMVNYITTNASKLGFENTNTACYDSEAETICSTSKEGQNKYLFLDDLHFTEAGHAIEAKWWLATLAGANGDASLQTGQLPRVIQHQLEGFQRKIKPGQYLIDGQNFAAYTSLISGSSKFKTSAQNAQSKLSHDGTILGMEGRAFGNLVIGAALSLGDTNTSFADGGGSKVKGGGFSLYAAAPVFDTNFSMKMTKGGHEIEGISRSTGVPFLVALGQTESNFKHVELAARRNFQFDQFELNAGLIASMAEIDVDAYTETSATGLNLRFEDQNLDTRSIALEMGTKGPELSFLAGDLKVRPIGQLTYTRQLGDDTYSVVSQLVENTANPVSRTLAAATENHFNLQLGLETDIAQNWRVDLRYEVNNASDIKSDDAASLNLLYRF